MMSGNDILLTNIHVNTDRPISDHMIGTSHNGHRIAVPRASREHAQAANVSAVYERQPANALLWPFMYMGQTGSGL
ncbi:unnamed protein product, partial [Staurois parvus]